MVEFLRCKDYFGRTVTLSERRWRRHILVDHAEMKHHRELIVEALIEPDLVNLDRDHQNRESFYKLDSAGSAGNRHVKVSVEYRRVGLFRRVEGAVVTAYIAKGVKKGENTKWRREN